MIPHYEETIRMIEERFPGWFWLMRNNPHDGQGKYFFHLYENLDQARANKSFRAYDDNPHAAVFRVYTDAQAIIH